MALTPVRLVISPEAEQHGRVSAEDWIAALRQRQRSQRCLCGLSCLFGARRKAARYQLQESEVDSASLSSDSDA